MMEMYIGFTYARTDNLLAHLKQDEEERRLDHV